MQQALNEHLKTESQQRDQLAMELTPALETMQRLAEAARRRVEEAAESQRLLEEAAGILKESEDRYFRLVELAPEMIAIHSDGKILFINPAGARLLGAQNAGKVIGTSFLDRIHPDSEAAVKERVRRVVEEHQMPRDRLYLMKSSGGNAIGEGLQRLFQKELLHLTHGRRRGCVGHYDATRSRNEVKEDG